MKSIINTLLVTITILILASLIGCGSTGANQVGSPGGVFRLDQDDNCPLVSNFNQKDTNGNGIGNACDDKKEEKGPVWHGSFILKTLEGTPKVVIYFRGGRYKHAAKDAVQVEGRQNEDGDFEFYIPNKNTIFHQTILVDQDGHVGVLTKLPETECQFWTGLARQSFGGMHMCMQGICGETYKAYMDDIRIDAEYEEACSKL